jgi:NAD(P)-dependent dehydrogenase (short-subunit alcohol dehydrogenase family)
MDPETIDQIFKSLLHTEVTKTVHRDIYPALLPSRPELSQAGRVVLVTGGGTGVGYSIARAFVQASADTVIIIGRRADVLATSAALLEQEAKATGTNTKIIARPCDVVNLAEVETFWKELAAQGITVDVYTANAAKFTEPKPILELGADEVWSQMEVNVKSPLYFVEKFYAQPGEKQKVSLLSFHLILPVILSLSTIK